MYGRETSPINVGTDKKSRHNRLNKERMDLEYVTPSKSGSSGMVTMGCYVK
ncbi:hypothetical protein Tco_0190750, partial [Tanacetum coccineum]